MKFFRCVSYVHFVITLTSLGLMCYMYGKSQEHAEHAQEHAEHEIVIPPNLMLEKALENGIVRDTQIMQGILMTHHKLGIHPPGKQAMCPMCEPQEGDDLNTIMASSDRIER